MYQSADCIIHGDAMQLLQTLYRIAYVVDYCELQWQALVYTITFQTAAPWSGLKKRHLRWMLHLGAISGIGLDGLGWISGWGEV